MKKITVTLYLLVLVLTTNIACSIVSDDATDDVDTETSGSDTDTDTGTDTGTDTTTGTLDIDESQINISSCGNGIIDEGEKCDPGKFNATCTPYGMLGGYVVCTDECLIDTSNCKPNCQLDRPGCYCREECNPPGDGWVCEDVISNAPPMCVQGD